MCLPKAPKIPVPDPIQEVKQPDFTAITRARKKNASMAGGTLLTGPSGVATGAMNTGATTLLGG